MVLVLDIGEELSEAEIQNEYDGFKNLMSSETNFISLNKLLIDGEPAAVAKYKITRKASDNALGVGAQVYTMNYSVIYKNYYISLQCSVSGKEHDINLYKLMDQYEIVFKYIANSFVIQSKWEK